MLGTIDNYSIIFFYCRSVDLNCRREQFLDIYPIYRNNAFIFLVFSLQKRSLGSTITKI